MSETPATKKQRSPAYPAIDLREALVRAKKLYVKENRHAAALSVAAGHWGYQPTSSATLQTVSALKQFGLAIDSGNKEKRLVKLTDFGIKILIDDRPDSAERVLLVKEAALKPKLYALLWKHWSGNLPSDGNIAYELRANRAFNDKAVSGFIKDFRSTIAFAGLQSDDKASESQDEDGEHQEEEQQMQDQRANKGNSGEGRLANTAKKSPQGSKQDVFTLDEGEAVLQWPSQLSKESFQDLKDWIELSLRKIGRSIGRTTDGEEEADEKN